jgi:transposase
MARRAAQIDLAAEERTTLQNIVRSPSAAERDVMRARIVLLAAAGRRNEQIQETLQISKPMVVKWRRRFACDRLAGLRDRAGRGRKRKYDAAIRQRIAATASSRPPESNGTHWSVRALAKHLGVGASVVHAVLSAESIQLHRFRSSKHSHDPEFEPKTLAVIGLYMQRPQNAIVLSVDEKTSIPDLDRTQRGLPMKPHKIGRLSRESKRSGAASLLARLEVDSRQTRAPIPRNNGVIFIRFLRRLLLAYPDKDLCVILDNGSSERSKKMMAWVTKQERLRLTFTPTRASWLNQTEIWLGILARKAVRRGIFKSRDELIERLMTHITACNQQGRPFEWICPGNPLAA